jgi:catechol 2,3-dioxygenase-like lactoylglutathione lyase family enzyme
MKIEHLALAVRDPEASRAFYLDTIGLEARAEEKEWGIELHYPDGFMMALIRDDPVPAEFIERIHFGAPLARREDVAAARERLLAAGVPEVEWCDESDYISVKLADPDGYVIELFYELLE